MRHNSTVCRLMASFRATARPDSPSANNSTIRLRRTNRCGVVGARTQPSRTSRSSRDTSICRIRLGIGPAKFCRFLRNRRRSEGPDGQSPRMCDHSSNGSQKTSRAQSFFDACAGAGADFKPLRTRSKTRRVNNPENGSATERDGVRRMGDVAGRVFRRCSESA